MDEYSITLCQYIVVEYGFSSKEVISKNKSTDHLRLNVISKLLNLGQPLNGEIKYGKE
jgi:hypothetical protein